MPIYEYEGARPEFPASGRCWVAPSAVLVGKIKLDEMASIWFGAVLRGDNEPIHIGARTNIQDNCVLHTDPGFPLLVGEGATIGHKVMLHGCTIGAGCLIGMNAVVLNGAKVGEGSIIGANSLVAEGKEIPPGVLAVGSPARVLRELKPEQSLLLKAAAQVYVDRWQRYEKGLKLLADPQ